MTTRPSHDDLENEFLDIIDKGTLLDPSGVIDIGLPSRFILKCMREGSQQARVVYEVCGTFEPENINTTPYADIVEKLEVRVAGYLWSELADGLSSPDTTPYPEMAKDIVQVVLGYKHET